MERMRMETPDLTAANVEKIERKAEKSHQL